MTEALVIDRLAKRYGPVEALRGVDLAIRQGEIFGFLGPNGSGKSTTIRILLDLIRPTAGRAAILGHDCQVDSVEARRCVGYLPSDPTYPARSTALDAFEYTAAVRGMSLDRRYLDDLANRLQLDVSRKVSDLSRGNRQKVGLIQAVLTRAPLLILDEPTTGLDPLNQAEVEHILHEVADEGRTVFFSSHILSEVQALCTRAAIVRDGLVVDTVDLSQQRRLALVHVEVTLGEPLIASFEDLPPGVTLIAREGHRLVVETHDEAVDGLVKWLARGRVVRLEVREPTLDELFLRYYRAGNDPEPRS